MCSSSARRRPVAAAAAAAAPSLRWCSSSHNSLSAPARTSCRCAVPAASQLCRYRWCSNDRCNQAPLYFGCSLSGLQGSVLLWLFCPNQPRGDRTILNGKIQLRDFIVHDALSCGAVPPTLPKGPDPQPPPPPPPATAAPAAEPSDSGPLATPPAEVEAAEETPAETAAAAPPPTATTEPFWDLFDRTVLHNL